MKLDKNDEIRHVFVVKIHLTFAQVKNSSAPVLVGALGWLGVGTWLRRRGTAAPGPALVSKGRNTGSTGPADWGEFSNEIEAIWDTIEML